MQRFLLFSWGREWKALPYVLLSSYETHNVMQQQRLLPNPYGRHVTARPEARKRCRPSRARPYRTLLCVGGGGQPTARMAQTPDERSSCLAGTADSLEVASVRDAVPCDDRRPHADTVTELRARRVASRTGPGGQVDFLLSSTFPLASCERLILTFPLSWLFFIQTSDAPKVEMTPKKRPASLDSTQMDWPR